MIKLTKNGKVILSKLIDPEQKERSKDEAKSMIRDWSNETGLYGIGTCNILKIDASSYFENQ